MFENTQFYSIVKNYKNSIKTIVWCVNVEISLYPGRLHFGSTSYRVIANECQFLNRMSKLISLWDRTNIQLTCLALADEAGMEINIVFKSSGKITGNFRRFSFSTRLGSDTNESYMSLRAIRPWLQIYESVKHLPTCKWVVPKIYIQR